jgi:hypothetical protein
MDKSEKFSFIIEKFVEELKRQEITFPSLVIEYGFEAYSSAREADRNHRYVSMITLNGMDWKFGIFLIEPSSGYISVSPRNAIKSRASYNLINHISRRCVKNPECGYLEEFLRGAIDRGLKMILERTENAIIDSVLNQ